MEIGPLQNSNENKPENISVRRESVNSVEVNKKKDSILISENAREKLAKLADDALKEFGVGEMPSKQTDNDDSEIRIDKIKLAKERIESGYYKQIKIVGQIADRLVDQIKESKNKDKDQE